jgi:tetrahydromethanopterin S-methyltransferase subunit G
MAGEEPNHAHPESSEANFMDIAKGLEDMRQFVSFQVGKLQTQIGGLEHRIDNLQSDMNRQFEAIDGRFREVDRRFDRIDGKLELLVNALIKSPSN